MIMTLEAWGVNSTEDKHEVYLDTEGNFRTQEPMKIRDRNYLRFSMQKDFSRINPVHTRVLLKDPEIFLPVIQLYNPNTVVLDNMEDFDAVMPNRPEIEDLQGLTPHIVSLPDNQGITDWSYHYWLRMQTHTHQFFKNLNPPPSRGVGDYNITTRRRT